MLAKAESQVRREQFEQSSLTDEIVERSLIVRMVKEMELKDLKKIFNIQRIDPREKINLQGLSQNDKDVLSRLAHENIILFKAEINIPEDYNEFDQEQRGWRPK